MFSSKIIGHLSLQLLIETRDIMQPLQLEAPRQPPTNQLQAKVQEEQFAAWKEEGEDNVVSVGKSSKKSSSKKSKKKKSRKSK